MSIVTQKQLGARIKNIRDFLKFSQGDIAKHLGILRQSVSQIEKGDRGIDSIELAKLAELFSVSVDNLLKKEKVGIREIKTGNNIKKMNVPLNKEKFKNTLLYILGKCGGKPNLGETVLYKLLYFIDFDAYELLGKPITGMEYIKLQYGPVPKSADYVPLIGEMVKTEELVLVKQKYHNKIQKRYVAFKKANTSVFSAEELEIINKVIDRLSDMSAVQIEEYVHGDIPWKGSEDRQAIDYNAVYYRNPPYAQKDYDEIMQDAAGRDAVNELAPISKEEYDHYMKLK